MKSKTLLILLVTLANIHIGISCAAAKQHEYKTYQIKNEKTVNRFWIEIGDLLEGKREASFKKIEGDRVEVETYVLDENYATLEWAVECKVDKTSYKGKRNGNVLFLEGEFRNKKIDKKIAIDSDPLFINPKIGLMGFVSSGQEKAHFWAMRNDTLEVFKMVGKNQDQESVSVQGNELTATRVFWAPKGPGSVFFNRKYWFRVSDNLYVKQTTSKKRMRVLVK